jgi:hypothetical protein
MHVYRFGRDDSSQTTGGWIAGVVGSGKNLAVSTWESKGTVATDRRLSLVSPAGLQPLAGGEGSIVAQAAESGHLATLSSSPWATATTADIYSGDGIQVYGRLGVYSVFAGYVGANERLHILDLTTGKDVELALVKGFGANRTWAIGPRGLVYVVNRGPLKGAGKLVFVPLAKLLATLNS